MATAQLLQTVVRGLNEVQKRTDESSRQTARLRADFLERIEKATEQLQDSAVYLRQLGRLVEEEISPLTATARDMMSAIPQFTEEGGRYIKKQASATLHSQSLSLINRLSRGLPRLQVTLSRPFLQRARPSPWQLAARRRFSFLSRASMFSFGSLLSFSSFCSVLSVNSAGSVLSIGSAGSILSIGSVGSILSIRSTQSILSIGGKRTVLHRRNRAGSTLGTAADQPQSATTADTDGDQAAKGNNDSPVTDTAS
ncbi:MAG: hypothetical protein M1296_05610 [Chloroflexi bacterium]|nr:hypothetical protein [Chloroflexota bacterium]